MEREKELQLAFPRRKAKQVSASQAPTAVSLSLPLYQDPAVGDSAAPAIKGKIGKSKKAGGAGVKQAAVADADTVDVMDVSGNVEEAEDAAVAARALTAVTHALVTRHAGFDGATGQAVSLLSALAANRMESMGAALRAAQPCMPASSSGAGFCAAAACTVLPACLARARLCSLGAVQSEIVKLPPKMSAAAALAERNKVGINMGPIPQIRLVFTCVCPVACPCNTPAYLHRSLQRVRSPPCLGGQILFALRCPGTKHRHVDRMEISLLCLRNRMEMSVLCLRNLEARVLGSLVPGGGR